jgi:hypothetical protein
MTESRMRLDQVSKQLGFNTRASGKEDSPIDSSGSLNDHDNPEESEILNARIMDQEEDSQPVEKKPGLRMALMTGLLASTIGVGITVTLWNSSNPKTADAQKPKGTTPVANENTDKDKEVSDLKAEVAIQKQKEDAAKLVASKTKTAPTASPSPSASMTASVSPSPRSTATVQANAASSNNQATVQPSRPQQVAKVASSRTNDQDNGQLAALRSAVQRERNTLADLRKQQTTLQKQQATTQTVKPTRNQSVQPTEVAKQTTRQASSQSSTNSSWEDVAASGNYGGTGTTPSPSSTGTNIASTGTSTDQIASADDRGGPMSPQLRLPVGESVSAKLVTPFYTLVKNTGYSQISQSTDKNFASIVTENPIEMGSGWRIPAKSVIEFSMQVADNGLIQAVSKRVISGNVVIPVPQGAFTLTSENSQPLQAEVRTVNGDQLARSDIMTTIWGAAGEVGKSLAESGNQSTVAVGANTVISNVNNQVSGNNILGSVLKGGATQIIQQSTDRNKSQAQQLEKQSKVAFLNPGTKARVFVSQSVAFQVPLEGAAQAGLIDPRTTQISRADVPASEDSLAPIVSNSSSADTSAPPPAPPTAAETDPDVAAKTAAQRLTRNTPEVQTAPASSGSTPNMPRSIID